MTPKAWGFTSELFEKPFLSFYVCFANLNGYCSLHYHEAKRNTFYVYDGLLKVVTFNQAGMTSDVLTRGQSLDVERFVPHFFIALTPTQFFEMYTGDSVEADDIKRIVDGGVCLDMTINELQGKMHEEYGKFRKAIA